MRKRSAIQPATKATTATKKTKTTGEKAVKEGKAKATSTSKKATSAKSTTSKKVSNATNKLNDKSVGKDDKGRTIYEGPKGGNYYINSNGNKTYLKKK